MRQPVPFGKYLLLDRISVGGMAEVFKAKSYGVEGFEKIIAIKRILPTMGEDRDFIKMFIDEAKIAGQLAHANICQIFELGRIDGSHFIAMEYIWGKDLLQIQNRLRKIKQPMPVPMACFVLAKVLEGLDYAHRKRDPLGRPLEIVHRDCSPQNVLVSYEGEVKVIDFGIAKATSRNSRTMAGVLKGKFGYMSPEQVRGLPLDRRSDIFALGTMLYECLTSDRLFQGETDFSTLEKVRNVDIRPPRELNPNIPASVEAVILKALAKDTEDRYQWCSEMLVDLQAYLMSQEVVFTAKSLAGWLKEVFNAEIDRERQQLEQYKRVGRDGLIAGVPAADAKLDVVETLGEAGAPEGDATQLGGPNFDDIEEAVAAGPAPEVGPAPGSPAARGSAVGDDDEDSEEFGEEAPTEIFGEIDGQQPAAAAAPPQRSPTASQPPASRGSKPSSTPPPRSPISKRPSDPPYAGNGRLAGGSAPPQNASLSSAEKTMNLSDADIISPVSQRSAREAFASNLPGLAPIAQPSAQHVYGGANPIQHRPTAMPGGTPQQMPSTQNPARTLMGAATPPGVQSSGQGYPQSVPPVMYPQNPYGSQPQLGYAQVFPPGHPMAGMPMYGQYQSAGGLEQALEGPKRSSIGRDVAIGVAIAAFVLGGFLAVKFFVLDPPIEPGATAVEPAIATIRVAMPDNMTGELFLDDELIATVANKAEVNVNAGKRKIKLIGPNGVSCVTEMRLPGGKTTTVECIIETGSDGSAAPPPPHDKGGSAGSATTPAAAVAPISAVPDKPGDKVVPVEVANPPSDKPADKARPTDKKTGKLPVENSQPAITGTKGYLNILSKPSAQILIDGKETGLMTPVTGGKLELEPGRHKVTFVIGNDKHTFPVFIKAGQTEQLSKDLK